MEDKKKQVVQWDFPELKNSLDTLYNSPERLLLEAHKGLLSLVSDLKNDVCAGAIQDSIFPIIAILNDIYSAVLKKEDDEFYLAHPDINRKTDK